MQTTELEKSMRISGWVYSILKENNWISIFHCRELFIGGYLFAPLLRRLWWLLFNSFHSSDIFHPSLLSKSRNAKGLVLINEQICLAPQYHYHYQPSLSASLLDSSLYPLNNNHPPQLNPFRYVVLLLPPLQSVLQATAHRPLKVNRSLPCLILPVQHNCNIDKWSFKGCTTRFRLPLPCWWQKQTQMIWQIYF